MWVLIIIVEMATGIAGGAHSSIATLEFSSQERCQEAAKVVAKDDHRVGEASAIIKASCVQK